MKLSECRKGAEGGPRQQGGPCWQRVPTARAAVGTRACVAGVWDTVFRGAAEGISGRAGIQHWISLNVCLERCPVCMEPSRVCLCGAHRHCTSLPLVPLAQ